jgi:hypothetical protein
MVERLGLSADDAKRDNPCFNEGVLLGDTSSSPTKRHYRTSFAETVPTCAKFGEYKGDYTRRAQTTCAPVQGV